MLAKSRRHGRHLRLVLPGGLDEQPLDQLAGIGFGGLGQVKVDVGGLEAGMAEILLDRLEAGSRFKQMGGVAVSEGVGGDLLAKIELAGDPLDGSLHRSDAQGGIGLGDLLAGAAVGGKEITGMPMGLPVIAEPMEGGSGQRDVAVLGPFAAMDVDHHPLGVEIADLQAAGFLKPQSKGIDGPEEGGHPEGGAGVEDLADLLAGEDFGKCLERLQAGVGEGLPVAGAGACEEELDAAERDPQGSVGQFPFVLEVQQPVTQLLFGDLVRGTAAEVGQLADGAEVAVHRSLGHAGQVQVVFHSLVKRALEVLGRGGESVIDHRSISWVKGRNHRRKMAHARENEFDALFTAR